MLKNRENQNDRDLKYEQNCKKIHFNQVNCKQEDPTEDILEHGNRFRYF